VTQNPILSCKVLDIGCGTGDNSIWLAQNRFQVIGTDTSEIALGKAREKASKANVECDFILVDFLKNKIEGAPFGLYLTEAVFTHSVLKMIEEGLPKMLLFIWKQMADG